MIMYDGMMKAFKDGSRINVEQDRHRNIQQYKKSSKTATKKQHKKNKTKKQHQKNKKKQKKCNLIHFKSVRTVNPIASNSTLWMRF